MYSLQDRRPQPRHPHSLSASPDPHIGPYTHSNASALDLDHHLDHDEYDPPRLEQDEDQPLPLPRPVPSSDSVLGSHGSASTFVSDSDSDSVSSSSIHRLHHAHSYSQQFEFVSSDPNYILTGDLSVGLPNGLPSAGNGSLPSAGNGNGGPPNAGNGPGTPLTMPNRPPRQINNIVIDTSRLHYPSDLSSVSPRSSLLRPRSADNNSSHSSTAHVPLLQSHPINVNMPYALRQRDLGPDEQASSMSMYSIYSSSDQHLPQATNPVHHLYPQDHHQNHHNHHQDPLDQDSTRPRSLGRAFLSPPQSPTSPTPFHKALVPVYYSPTTDSISSFPYKNSIMPERYSSRFHSHQNTVSTMYPVTVSSDITSSKSPPLVPAPDLVPSSHAKLHRNGYQPLDQSPTDPTGPQSGTYFGPEAFLQHKLSNNNLPLEKIHPPTQLPPPHPIRLRQPSPSNSLFWLDKENARPKWSEAPPDAPPAAAKLVLGLCILFPPAWLLYWYGSFDHLLGTVPRKYKLMALSLASSFLLIVIACIIVGLVVGTR